MRLLDAAAKVLEEAGEPLHYLILMERMLSSGLWETRCQTPEISVSSQVSLDIRENPRSRFARVGRGVYGLRLWDSEGEAPEPEDFLVEEAGTDDSSTEAILRLLGLGARREVSTRQSERARRTLRRAA